MKNKRNPDEKMLRIRDKEQYEKGVKRHLARIAKMKREDPPIPDKSEFFNCVEGVPTPHIVLPGSGVVVLINPKRLSKRFRFVVAALAMVEWNERWPPTVSFIEVLKLNQIVEHWKIWRELEQ